MGCLLLRPHTFCSAYRMHIYLLTGWWKQQLIYKYIYIQIYACLFQLLTNLCNYSIYFVILNDFATQMELADRSYSKDGSVLFERSQ